MNDELPEPVEQGRLTGWAALGGRPKPTAEDVAKQKEMGARIAAARRKRGLTGTQLGEVIGLRKDQISKLESGRRGVDITELVILAEALGVTMGYVLGEPERPAMAISTRLASGALPAATARARQRARLLIGYDDLLTQIGVLTPARPSKHGARVLEQVERVFADAPKTRAKSQAQGIAVAELVRRELDLGGAPIYNMASLIEKHFAVDVSISPLGTDADGLCVHAGSVALIIASSDHSDGHLRFTLAHELAHHLFNDPCEIIEEDEQAMSADAVLEWRANAFAGHLLVPARSVHDVLEWLDESPKEASDRCVVTMMEEIGVPLEALLHELDLLGVMSFEDGQRLLHEHTIEELLQRHGDVAPTGAATRVSQMHRAPERLIRHAVAAARQERTGLTIVAGLLDREDDDSLWNDIMGPEYDYTTPVPL
ncbi:MAG TPA: XRE family transcriptional regulator [Pseudonocardiaceae bacterium]|jgi:Zn-dependent peptidase ImmA (M78 family)/DNA-binding XRE family transcriptional regulator